MIEVISNPQVAALKYGMENAETVAPGDTKFAKILRESKGPGASMDEIFSKASERYQVPEQLIKAIAFHESRYRPDVVSSAGAMGVMQLMPATAKEMGVKDPFDAEQNIMGGAKLLGQLFSKYDGDLKLTLAAYGAGSGSVAKYNGVPPFTETQNFVRDIMSVVGEQVEYTPATAPVHTTAAYTNMLSGISSFDDFTQEDYRLFLAYLLHQQESILLGDGEDNGRMTTL